MKKRVQPPSGIITIIFTDIENSTRMTQALGDAIYRDHMRAPHCLRIDQAIAEHRGYFVKTIGDSYMIVFQRADDAVACAIAIQKSLDNPPISKTDQTGKLWTVKVRIGVHRSEKELQPGLVPGANADYLGGDVNFAARVESLGAGQQIIISDLTYRSLATHTRYSWHEWPSRRVKSFSHPETVWELKWDGQESRGEPGARFLPDWFKGEVNRYIPRPQLTEDILGHFGKLQPDGRVPRLVTLHAFGGMGKTRLAIACAIQAAGVFQDGVFFVNLEDKSPSASAVAEAIHAALAAPLRLPPEASLPENLIAKLSAHDILLVLDTYESVECEEVQSFLITLLKRTNAVRLLITGREAVKISDLEQEISLDNGMVQNEAFELFLARARLKHQQGQTWNPNPLELTAINRILQLTDHIPLAIELAAAWVNKSSVQAIADGIETTPLGRESNEPPRSRRLGQTERHRSLTRVAGKRGFRGVQEVRPGFRGPAHELADLAGILPDLAADRKLASRNPEPFL